MSIAENVKLVKENIAAAAIRCGRDPKEIKLVAATKMNDASRVHEAIAAGQLCLVDGFQRAGALEGHIVVLIIHQLIHCQRVLCLAACASCRIGIACC